METQETLKILEFLILGGIVILQGWVTFKCRNLIKTFKQTFKVPLTTQLYSISREDIISEDAMDKIIKIDDPFSTLHVETEIEITLLDIDSENNISVNIHDSINNYLLNNYGAPVNFSTIKDMVDREIDVNDDEITNLIPTPLYLGLAATMAGIIIGLWSMPEINNDEFTQSINVLIDGVKYAMAASLAGLICTTYLSSLVYKEAKKEVLEGKNKLLSYLQAKLLPALIKAEETGLAGLKNSIDNFSRVGTEISEKIGRAAAQTSSSIDKQLETIEKVENLKMHKVTKANLDLFEKLENSVKLIENFESNIISIERISDHLNSFSQRTKDIDIIAQSIKQNIEDSNSQVNISRELNEFLTQHFKQLEQHGTKVQEAVSFNELYLEKAITTLKERIEILFGNFNEAASNHQISLEKGYETIAHSIQQVSLNQIEEYRKLYENAPPQFKQLEKLTYLEELNKLGEISNTTISSLEELKTLNKLEEVSQTKDSQSFTELSKINGKQQEIIDGIDDLIVQFKKGKQATSKTVKTESVSAPKNRKKRRNRRVFRIFTDAFSRFKKKPTLTEDKDAEN
ncbi:hypothetical protein ACV07N_13285 [Roseivirga echinicomitans]